METLIQNMSTELAQIFPTISKIALSVIRLSIGQTALIILAIFILWNQHKIKKMLKSLLEDKTSEKNKP
jgi:predicted PurR-regulated permease PerM